MVTFTDSRSPAFSSKYQNQIMLSWPITFKPLKMALSPKQVMQYYNNQILNV